MGNVKRWTSKLLIALAVLYPVVLLAIILVLHFVGERWWLTGVVLYLPRAVFAAPLPLLVIALLALKERRLLLTQAVAAVLLVFPLMGFVLPWPTFADDHEPKLKILSYNVNSGFQGLEHIADEIDRVSPDLVFLQELPFDPAVLRERLRAVYPHISVSSQFITASRFPILSTDEPERLGFYGDARSPRFVRYLIDTPLGQMAFYNVHPVSPRGAFYSLRGGGLRHEILSGRFFVGDGTDSMRVHSELRELQVRTFAERAAQEKDPVVIAGDTNLPGLSAIFRQHLSHFQDGFTEAGWGFGYTFPSNRFRWMRIDRVMAGPGLRFTGFEVCAPGASDHACVVADLQRKH